MDHGTKDPKTGNDLTYEVSLNRGLEDMEEYKEKEDTVFSEEEERLVKESVRRMHGRLLRKKNHQPTMWPNVEKRKKQRNHPNIEMRGGQRQRNGLRIVGISM